MFWFQGTDTPNPRQSLLPVSLRRVAAAEKKEIHHNFRIPIFPSESVRLTHPDRDDNVGRKDGTDTGFGCGDGKRPSTHRRFQFQEVVGGTDQAPFAPRFP